MKEINKTELADTLLNWYWENKNKIKNNKRFWSKDILGYAISSIVKEENRWKNAPRGKPGLKNFEGTNEFDIDF